MTYFAVFEMGERVECFLPCTDTHMHAHTHAYIHSHVHTHTHTHTKHFPSLSAAKINYCLCIDRQLPSWWRRIYLQVGLHKRIICKWNWVRQRLICEWKPQQHINSPPARSQKLIPVRRAAISLLMLCFNFHPSSAYLFPSTAEADGQHRVP